MERPPTLSAQRRVTASGVEVLQRYTTDIAVLLVNESGDESDDRPLIKHASRSASDIGMPSIDRVLVALALIAVGQKLIMQRTVAKSNSQTTSVPAQASGLQPSDSAESFVQVPTCKFFS